MVLPWIELNDEHGHVPVTRLGSGYASPEMLCLGWKAERSPDVVSLWEL